MEWSSIDDESWSENRGLKEKMGIKVVRTP